MEHKIEFMSLEREIPITPQSHTDASDSLSSTGRVLRPVDQIPPITMIHCRDKEIVFNLVTGEVKPEPITLQQDVAVSITPDISQNQKRRQKKTK